MVISKALSRSGICAWSAVLVFIGVGLGIARGQTAPAPEPSITVDWSDKLLTSRSTPTLQVVVNPMLQAGSPIAASAMQAVKMLGADDVRYVPWLPYPKLSVAELEPPTKDGTSWDFKLIDPMTTAFLQATQGHNTVMNFSTIPAWLFKTKEPVTYPADADKVDWNYTQGTELRDPTGKELGDYYGRLVSWYTKGGFTDENGKVHTSGYHYSFPVWEVLNEVEFEHATTPEQYTERYDAIVSAIAQVSPETKFMGLALAMPSNDPRYFEYFLNHANHKPGIPLDYISYHFYASPTPGQDLSNWQYTFFDEADKFLSTVRYVEQIRMRLSPETKTDADELGVILPTDNTPKDADVVIPARYWNAAGALYVYLYMELAKQGIEVIGESQLVGYPTQFPSVTMVDWKSGKPNARYWVLKLIKDNFHPGDVMVKTKVDLGPNIAAQAFVTSTGKKLLLVNKRDRAVAVRLPADAAASSLATVDEATGEDPARISQQRGEVLLMAPFAVVVASLH